MAKIEKLHSVRHIVEQFDLSERKIRAMIASGEIRAIKIGGNVRIPESELRRIAGGDQGGEHRGA